jgi:formate hydrogenlyase transcriptional activator
VLLTDLIARFTHVASIAIERAISYHDLQQRERESRLIVDSIPGMVALLTPSGDVEVVNPQLIEYFGQTLTQLREWRMTDTIHPEDLPHVIEVFTRSIASGSPYEIVQRFRRSDGVYRWFLNCGLPVRDSGGQIARWCVLLTDIDERKRAEDALRDSEGNLQLIIDTIPALAWSARPDGSAEFFNQHYLDFVGLSAEQASGWGWTGAVHPEDVNQLAATWQGVLASDTAGQAEARLRRHDGTYRWFLFRTSPLRDETGAIVRWYGVNTDIEDRKRAEAELGALKDQLYQENLVLRDEVDRTSMFEEIVGTSKPLNAVLSRLSKVAPADSTVLITGETGTGKELVARAIHRRSPRGSRTFVSVNCAAVPRELIASELFGHEKGAFTGATQRRLGRFELAHGGTIFLDEVGELPMETQVALLRVLQEREFERVGGSIPIRADVRVIAATNRDLPAAIEAGMFRRDLFYRLNVFPIAVPPLRERAEDISLLVEYFIDRYARKAGKTIRRVSKRTVDHLRAYPWPGNVRELQNVIERSVIVCETDEFTVDESWLSARPAIERPLALSGTLAAHEKTIIEDALRACGGRVFGPAGAAERLGIPRSTLESKIRALRINKNRFRSRSSNS